MAISENQIREYLKNVKALEVSLYSQRQLADKLRAKSDAKDQEIRRAKAEPLPATPVLEQSNFAGRFLGGLIGPELVIFESTSGIGSFLARLTLWMCVHYIIGAVVLWLLYHIPLVSGWAINTFGTAHSGNPAYFYVGIIVSHIASLLFSLLTMQSDNVKDQRKYEQELVELDQSKAAQRAALNRLRNERTDLSDWLIACHESIRETQAALEQLYAVNLIYPKYRSLVAVCTMYEYLDSGRCAALTGHEGAYNLYESELRMNMIIGKLEEINNKLDQIQANQHVLAQALAESTRQTQRMLYRVDASIRQAAVAAESAAYSAQIAAQNSSYLAILETADYYRNRT